MDTFKIGDTAEVIENCRGTVELKKGIKGSVVRIDKNYETITVNFPGLDLNKEQYFVGTGRNLLKKIS